MRPFPGGPVSASTLARWVDGALHGEDVEIVGVTPLSDAAPGALSYADGRVDPSLRPGLLLARTPSAQGPTIVIDDPKLAFILVLERLFIDSHEPGVHAGAYVHPTAVIGHQAVVYPGCHVGRGCRVGDRTILFPRVVLYPHTRVGADCRIHAGAVLGADGFSYHPTADGPRKVPQIGDVHIGDRVEVGANACVDRAFIGTTQVMDDVKIDNLVQIAHNVRIGNAAVIAAQTGVAGSATVGAGAVLAGQVGVADHARIGARAQVGAQAGVMGQVADDARVWGTPAIPLRLARRVAVTLRYLPDLWRRSN